MQDEAEQPAADASSSVPLTPLRERFLPSDSQYFCDYICELLSDEHTRATIKEQEFRSLLKMRILDKQLSLDDKKIAARLRVIADTAKAVADHRIVVEQLKLRWKRQRDEFLEKQAERRCERAKRNRALRNRPSPVNSDEEFDIPEPAITSSALQLSMAAAHRAYEGVKDRFAAEKEADTKSSADQRKQDRNKARREARRCELLSTAFASSSDVDSSAECSSSSSFSSSSFSSSSFSFSSSSPKRKFTAAAVTGVYTEFMAQQARQSAEIARELKESIRRTEEATAQYREKKLQSTEEYRYKKLQLLGSGKENVHPNREAQFEDQAHS
jgi:hypothetical protein